jgi:uncharacterized repeat protein (TIGR03803 family)
MATKCDDLTSAVAARCALAMVAFTTLLLLGVQPTHAQSKSDLYDFCSQPGCIDGADPFGPLVWDKKGNLYGTTGYGGENGAGTVFELSPQVGGSCPSGSYSGHGWCETVLLSFNSSNGSYPVAGLLINGGNLYGTTENGGAFGYGSIFKVTGKGAVETLYSFCALPDCADGAHPSGRLRMDDLGNLYSNTYSGGAYNAGTIFRLSPSGAETVLYSFCSQPGCTDGEEPVASLVRDRRTNLYGTTQIGGISSYGIVFKLAPNGEETVLYSFCSQNGCTDGANPAGDLIGDKKGNLYGTTGNGGATGSGDSPNGFGTVFELSPEVGGSCPSGSFSGNGWCERVLHAFGGYADGCNPSGGLTMDQNGNLFGSDNGGCPVWTYPSTVFEITSGGSEIVLYSFPSGERSNAAPIMDKNGNLYGTANLGAAYGAGEVWEVTP